MHKNAHGISLAPYLCDGDFSASLSLSLLIFKNHSWQNVHSYESTISYVCNVIVISVFKALQKHQLTTHDNYNHNFVIFAYTRPPYWTELNLVMRSVHFGRKPNRKRVCGSLNRTSQNHYGSEPNRTKPNRDRSKLRQVYWIAQNRQPPPTELPISNSSY